MKGYICDSCKSAIVDGNENIYTIGVDDDCSGNTIVIARCDTGRTVLHFCNKHCMDDFIGTCISKSKPNMIVSL